MTGPLINVGDLTKPATVLIEKVSDAVGGIAKPWQIKRTAKAEAEAKLILAKADIEIGLLEQRAIERLIREEAAKQGNIENIATKALSNLASDSKPEELDKDWLSFFFDRCRNTSDEEMQSLWANVLAGQANKPGSFSKRSVELVSTLEKIDAQMFTKFCTTCWMVQGTYTSLIYDFFSPFGVPIYKELGINWDMLAHLDTLGLIRLHENGFFRDDLSACFPAIYFGQCTTVELPQGRDDIGLGNVLLTKVGEELAAICGAQPRKDFEAYVQNIWLGNGFTLSCPLSGETDT